MSLSGFRVNVGMQQGEQFIDLLKALIREPSVVGAERASMLTNQTSITRPVTG